MGNKDITVNYLSPVRAPAILTQPIADTILSPIADNQNTVIHSATVVSATLTSREYARSVKVELIGCIKVRNDWLQAHNSLCFLHIAKVDAIKVFDLERELVGVELTALDLTVGLWRPLGNVWIVGFQLEAIVVNVEQGPVDVAAQTGHVAVNYVVVVLVVIVGAVDQLLLGEFVDVSSDIVFDGECTLNCPCLTTLTRAKKCKERIKPGTDRI